MRDLILLLAVLIAVPVLAKPPLGEAVRANIIVQAANPEPRYAGTVMEGSSGIKAIKALERYNTDKVKEPRPSGKPSPFTVGAK